MAKIEKRVFRNAEGGTLGCAVLSVVAIGIAAGVAYGFGANVYGWACVGVGALGTVGLFGVHVYSVLDRSPKLVIDAEGIHDLRQTPPAEYDWGNYKKVFVDAQEGENKCPEVALEVVDRDGEAGRVVIAVTGLDAKPEEIAAAIEEVWEQVKALRAESGAADDEEDEDKPKPKKWKPKDKPWKNRDDEDEEEDKRDEKPKRWEW